MKKYSLILIAFLLFGCSTAYKPKIFEFSKKPFIKEKGIAESYHDWARKIEAVELDTDSDGYIDIGYMPLDQLWPFQAGITISTGQHFTLGTTQWDDGSDAIDGEQIADNTIDTDSIDWANVQGDIESAIDTYIDGSSDALQGFSLYDGDSNKATFSLPDLSGDITITFPSSTGTLQTAQTTFSGYGISDTLANLETALGINDIAQLGQNETVSGYWSNLILRMTQATGALGSIATGDIIRDDGTYDPWGASLGVSGFGMKTTTGYALWGDETGKFYWDNIVLSSGSENDIVTLDASKQIQASSPATVLGILKDADAGIWQHVVVPIGSINPDGTYCAAWAEDPGTAGYRSMASACSGGDDGYLRFTIPMPENWDGADAASELKIGIWWWVSAEDPGAGDSGDTIIWDAKVAPVDMHEIPGTDVTWTQAAADTYTILAGDDQYELLYSEIDVDSAVSGSGGDLLFVSIWNDVANETYDEPVSVLGIMIYYKIDDLDSMD